MPPSGFLPAVIQLFGAKLKIACALFVSALGDDAMDQRIRNSTTAKYVNDFCQLVFMYTADISRIKAQIPKLISLTKFGKSCLFAVGSI